MQSLEYRFVYVKVHKTRSAIVRRAITECGGGKGEKPWCLLPAQPHFQEIRDNWQDFFVFTVVRNPWTRAAEHYNYLTNKLEDLPGCKAAVAWDDFCREPLRLAGFAKRRPECAIQRSPSAIASHVHHQTSCARSQHGGWLVDFLGRTERLDADLQEVARRVNLRKDAELPPMLIPHVAIGTDPSCDDNSDDGPAAQSGIEGCIGMYNGSHRHCIDGVKAFYRDDFDLLFS